MDEQALEKIPRFSWATFKKHLEEKKPFEAISPMGTALFRVKSYEPIVGLAVHAGHLVREELLSKMAIDESERLYEEDAGVDDFISDFPIQMIGLDSRFEYDVNRVREQSVYLKPFQSWGRKVWLNPPTKEELEISYQKYDEFHEMLEYLVEQVIAQFGKALTLDVHSYNFRRPNQAGKGGSLPVFNLATSPGDHEQHGKSLKALITELSAVRLPGTTTTVKENDVFKKDGAISVELEKKFPKCLSVPVEVKKIYMDETTGEKNRDITAILRKSFLSAARNVSRTM